MQKQQIRSKIPTYFIPLVLIMAASLSACQYTLEEILATATASSLTETAAEIQLTQIAACQSDATNCGEGNQDPRIQFVGILDIPDQVQADKPFTVKVASNYPQPSPLLAYQGNIIIEIDGVVACEFSLDSQLSAPVYLFGIPGLGLLSGGQRAGDCTIDISQLGFHKLAAISYGNDVYRRAVVETIIEVVVEPTIPTCQSDATLCGSGGNDPQIQFVEVPDFPEQIQTGEPLLVKVASNYPQPGGLLAYQGNIIIEIDDVVACEFSLDTQLSAPVYLFGSQLIVGDQWVGDCTIDLSQPGFHKLTAISYGNDVYRRAVVETVIEVIDSGEPLPPTPTCQSDATYCGGGTQDPGIKFVEVPDFPDQILADEPFTVKVASNYPDQPYFPSNLAYQGNIIIEIDGVVACEFSLDTQLSEPQYLFGSPASGILLGGQRTGECMIDIPQLGFHKLAAISYGNNVYRRAVVETVIEVVVEPTTPTCQTDATFCGEGQNDPRIQFVGVPEFPEQIQTSEPLLVKVASNYPQPGRLLGYRGNIIVEIDDIFACEFSLDEQLAPPIYALGSLLIAGDQWVGACTIDLPQPGIHKLTAISYANDIYQRSVVETIIEVIGSGAPPAPTATPTPPHTPTPPPTSTPSPTPTPTSSSTPTATEVSLSAVQMLLFSSAIAPIPPGTTVTFEVFVRSESGDLVGVVEIFSDNGESCSAGIQGSESVICTFRFDSIGKYGVSAVFTSTNGQHDSSSQGTVIIVEEVKVESAPTEEDEPTPKASPTPTEEPK